VADPPNLLTTRQREILRLIADGSSTKQIAADLDVSVKTVESHRAQIMAKLDIHDTAGLVRYAIRHGISEL
jgi:DNA-binding NarL/FixJ family response regulator